MIKIVFFDIDGTLKDNGAVPDSAKQAIGLLKEHGIIPALATGRPEFEVQHLRRELGIEYAVTCNGAHLGQNGETLDGSTPFPPGLVDKWLHTAHDKHTFLLYGAKDMFITNSDCPHFAQASREIGFRTPTPITAGDKLPDIYQVITFITEDEEAPYTDEADEPLYLHRWRTWAIDINPHGVNKAAGILKMIARLGFTIEEAAAFGDGLNDLEMIRSVGCGIAMGNGNPDLIALAKHVTHRIEDDGILHGVRTFILKEKATSESLS